MLIKMIVVPVGVGVQGTARLPSVIKLLAVLELVAKSPRRIHGDNSWS
jgi:hypothetical protein